jgi:FkbM family methyltransferase
VIYFKIRYPKSRIIAFEADSENVQLLKKNIEVNRLSEVEVVDAALWSSEGITDLYSEINDGDPWTWGKTVIRDIWGDADESARRTVRTTCLSRYVADEVVDFVKIDIEGAEEAVIREVQPLMHMIKELLIEFYGTNTSREVNDIGRISEMLECNGFAIGLIEKDLTKSFREMTITELDPDLMLIRAKNAAL